MQLNETKAQAVHIEWRFAVPPDKVWAAWTETDKVSQWFGSDPNGTVLNADLDVRPGGRFEVTFANADGTQYTASGIYQQVEPHRLLRFSWHWRNEPGVETAIRVALSPDGTGTRMQFEHGGPHPPLYSRLCDRLAQHLRENGESGREQDPTTH